MYSQTMRRTLAFAALVLLVFGPAAAQAPAPVNDAAIDGARAPLLLSTYRLFRDAAGREPNAGVVSYDIATPLYSDGALKFRYLYLPRGTQARYRPLGAFDFPVGAVLIKSFGYAADMRRPDADVRLIETRLLIRRAEGWVARAYVWNEAQTEARLAPAGAIVPASFVDEGGRQRALDWAVPNVNQCRGCHELDGAFVAIGPSARNLNRAYAGAANQLAAWREAGLVDALPQDAPALPNAYAEEAPLAARARAYLDVNCAHCHNPAGPAHTSGLDLRYEQNDPAAWGVMKRPVAAGRGAAEFEFAIEPGRPERSILVHRMQSTDPGVMMPELGRQLVDERGLALMREWIAAMPRD